MKVNFLGGADTQRSTNLSDSRCINLIPTTNDAGDVTGYYGAPGLALEKAITGGAVASGIYTASNGRCFMVASTTLYELTESGGVISLTSRGTVTAGTVTRFTDNGIQMIFVNGTDGWLYTFSTNALKKIIVSQDTFTVTIASPAVFTQTSHGLVEGDRLDLSSTGLLPTGLDTDTVYYVIAAGLTADAFEVSLTSGGAAINTSGTQSGTHTYTTIGYGFPEGCKTVSYMNGRFIACEPSTQNFYVSEVLDGFTWDVLNVQTVDSNPDNVVGEVVSHNELIVFCDNSGEVFYDAGATPSPFVRNASGVFEVGCAAAYSIAKIDNTVFWLGKNEVGQGVIYKLNGYTPQRISTFSMEYAIQLMTTISDAIAFTYQQDGHHFYVIGFPTGGKTFCFDINTGLWHERANFAAGVFSRWEAQEHAFFAGMHLVCDYTEGNIYSIDPTVYAYGTEVIKWLRSFRAPVKDMSRVRHNKLQLDCEAGVGVTGGDEPTVMMKFSDDGGHTWSSEVWRSMGIGSIGEYAKRVIWNRLGMTKGQPRIYELSGTAAVKTVLLNVYLD